MLAKQIFNSALFKQKSQSFFRGVDIPADLAEHTDIDHKSEADALASGLAQSQIDAIWAAVETFYAAGMHPGLSFCMRKNGKIILNRGMGIARGLLPEEGLDQPALMKADTPVCLYSASKAVTAMCVHKLTELGKIQLLDPVAHYIPEFAQAGKADISIHQMLSHRGGFPMIDSDTPMEILFDREEVLRRIYELPCQSPHGRIQAYHAITSGFIADELVRVTTGITIAEFLQKYFAKPMGMTNFTYGLSEDKRDQVARNYVSGMRNGKLIEGVLSKVFGVAIDTAVEMSNSQGFMSEIVPSANLYANAEEMSRFYQMLLDQGQYQSSTRAKAKQILEPITIQKAVREAGGMTLDKGIFLPMRFSAGFMLGASPVGMYGLNTPRAFGHLGFSNIFCWADPDRDISVALLSTGKPIIGSHILALPKLMHAISSHSFDADSNAA